MPLVPTNVIFVDHDAVGPTHDGTSWATAYTTVQDALAVATVGDEIWVAAGIYYPDEGTGTTADVPEATFRLKTGVALYGGFAGTEAALGDRDWEINLTVLSGDLTQNDPDKESSGTITDPSTIMAPNAYHVVSANNVDSSAILDGFTITAGYAYGSYSSPCGTVCGGGIYVDKGSSQLNHLAIRGNAANHRGGGISVDNSTVSLQNSSIQDNIAGFYGGGIYQRGGSFAATNVVVSGNRSSNTGGGISVDNSTLSLQNSSIQGNRVGLYGGGIYQRGGSFAATNVVVSGNRSFNTGGAIYNYLSTTPITLTNVTVSGNQTIYNGGGLVNRASTVLLRNSIIWGNVANDTPASYNSDGGTLTVEYSLIQNAYPGGSWDSTLGTDGGNNFARDPLFMAPINTTNLPTYTGDLRLQVLSPAADAGDSTRNNTLTDVDNQTRVQGAAVDLGAYESAYTANLTITKSVEPAIIEYGEPVTYTIVLTNSGDAFAYHTVLTDPMPSDVNFTSWLQQPAGAVYTTTGSPQIRWEGSVAAGGVNTYQFVVTHTGGPNETITNTVTYNHATGNASDAATFQVLSLPTVDIANVTSDEINGSATFTVALSVTSRKPVVVTYQTSDGSAQAGTDYTAITDTMTILAGDTEGTITIPVDSDFIDEESETFTVTLTGATDGTLGDATAVATIIDDDTAGSAVAPTILETDEPTGTTIFTITLASQPIAPVVVTLSNSDISECSVPADVTIDENNWQNGVSITVQAVDDFIIDGTQPCTITLSADSSDPLYHGIALAAVQVDVHSDDVAGIAVAPANPTVGEADLSGFFTVTLTSEPNAAVNIDMNISAGTKCSIGSGISLNAGNWQSGVVVPVPVFDDYLDDGDQTCTIQNSLTSADPNYDGQAIADVIVTVVDDDMVGVTIYPTALMISEPSGQTTFNISLTSEPTRPVTVNFTSLDTDECTVPTSITFDQNNWNVTVSVPVSAVDDLIDDADQLCVINTEVISRDAKYNGLATVDVDVTVQDDSDTAGVILDSTAVTVREPNTTATIRVTLNSEPVEPVTISLASQDSTECTVTNSVMLDASNWQTGQNITITAIDDNSIDDTQSCTITTTAASDDGSYDSIAVVDPLVTVEDDDYADIIVDSPNVIVSEPNDSMIMILKLTSIPTAPVTLALSSTDPTECNVHGSVVLNPTNWNSGVGIFVFAVNDDVDDGDHICNIRAAITSDDGHYAGLAAIDFPTTVVDDDSAGTVVSVTTLNVSEPAGNATFTVALTSEPTATVTINLVSGDSTECSVPATTTLDASNWQAGVIVTVSAVDDDVDDETQSCPVQTSSSSNDANYRAIAIDDVTVSVADDDTAGVVVTPTALTIGEPAITDIFTIRLTSEPIQTVTVNLYSDDLSECTVPATVLLDATNWAQGVAVPVQAVDDRIDDANQTCGVATVVASADRGYAGIAADDVTVTVQDDADAVGIVIWPLALTVSEPLESAAFTVALTSEPLTTVTINLAADDSSACSVPASVGFDATNWETGLVVTVSAVNDDVDDGTQQCIVQTSATSGDPLYSGMAIADVQTTVLDEDSAGMLLSTTALTVTEPNAMLTYTISLTSEPIAPVNVALQSNDTTECSVSAMVVLDATNWHGVAVPLQTVNDDVMDGSQRCAIQSTVSSTDPLYNATLLDDVVTIVLDEDVAGIVVAPTSLTIDELGGTAVFTISLTSEPTSAVSVDLASLDTTECTLPANVTIEPQNWRTGLPLRVIAVDDFEADGDQACTIETGDVVSLDGSYHGMVVDDVTTIVRDDERSVLLDPATSIVKEPNGTATVTVRLGSEPMAPVLLSFNSGDAGECQVSSTATLDATNWRDGAMLTLTAVDDVVDDGPQLCMITTEVVSEDAGYDDLSVDGLPVVVEDDEEVTIQATVQASTVTNTAIAEVGELITYTYQVVNTGDVSLTVAAIDSALGSVTFDQAPLDQAIVAPQATIQGQLTRTAQEGDWPGPLVSTAAFTAQSAMGSVITATQTTTVAVTAHPRLVLNVQRLGPQIVSPSTVVTFQLTITNTRQIPAMITSCQGAAMPLAQKVEAEKINETTVGGARTAILVECNAPGIIAAGAVHQCTMLWTAEKGDSETVEFVVRVDAEGPLNFTSTSSDSDIVIVSGPTAVDSLRVYLPMVSR